MNDATELTWFIDDEGNEAPLDLSGFATDITRLTVMMTTDSLEADGFAQVLELRRSSGSKAYTALVFQRAAAAFMSWVVEECPISLVSLVTKNFTEFVRGYRYIRPGPPEVKK